MANSKQLHGVSLGSFDDMTRPLPGATTGATTGAITPGATTTAPVQTSPQGYPVVPSADVSGEITSYTAENTLSAILNQTTDVELAIAAGLLTSLNPEDQAKVIKRFIPDAVIKQDETGTFVVEIDGQMGYINAPGLSPMDFTQTAAQVLEYVPAARLAALGKGLVRRMAIGSAAAGGTALTNDQVAAQLRDELGADVDVPSVMVAMVAGVAAEAVAPVAGYVGKKVRGLKGDLDMAAMVGESVPAGAGEGMVIPPTGAAAGPARQAMAADPAITPEAVSDIAEFNIPLTAGQGRTNVGLPEAPGQGTTPFTTAGKFLDEEEALRSGVRGEPGQVAMRTLESQQRTAIETSITDTLEQLAKTHPGTTVAGDVRGAAEGVLSGVRGAEKALGAAAGDAYERIPGDTMFFPGSFSRLMGFVRGELEPMQPGLAGKQTDWQKIFKAGLQPKAEEALNYIKGIVTNSKNHFLRTSEAGKNLNYPAFGHLQAVRRELGEYIGAAGTNATAKKQLTRIKDGFDTWWSDMVDYAIVNGDRNALDSILEARTLWARYANNFRGRGKHDGAGRIVQKMIENPDYTVDNAISAILGSGKVLKTGGNQKAIVDRLRTIFGTDTTGKFSESTLRTSEGWSSLRQAYFLRLIESGRIANDQISGQQLKTRTVDLIFGKGAATFNTLFTKTEGNRIRRQVRAILRTQPKQPVSRDNPSGSAAALAKAIGPIARLLGIAGDPMTAGAAIGVTRLFGTGRGGAKRALKPAAAKPGKTDVALGRAATMASPTLPEDVQDVVKSGVVAPMNMMSGAIDSF